MKYSYPVINCVFVGILKIKPIDQRLFTSENDVLEDESTLQDNGITMATAKAQQPAQLGLAIRNDIGEFENLEIAAYSSPPDLPEVMKNQEASNGKDPVA